MMKLYDVAREALEKEQDLKAFLMEGFKKVQDVKSVISKDGDIFVVEYEFDLHLAELKSVSKLAVIVKRDFKDSDLKELASFMTKEKVGNGVVFTMLDEIDENKDDSIKILNKDEFVKFVAFNMVEVSLEE